MITTIPTMLDLDLIANQIRSLTNWKQSGPEQDVEMWKEQGSTAWRSVWWLATVVQDIWRHRPHTQALWLQVNRVLPGKDIEIHQDWLPPSPLQGQHPTLERWHLPVVTNDKCGYWDGVQGEMIMRTGYWHGCVPYWKKHKIWNHGTEPRVHIVVDLDCPERLGEYE